MSYKQADPTICCDTCQTILNGQDRAAFVAKDYIKIQGIFQWETYNSSAQRYLFKKITRSPAEELHFCDFNCLQGYSKGRCDGFDKGLLEGKFLVRGVNDGVVATTRRSPSMERYPYNNRNEEEGY